MPQPNTSKTMMKPTKVWTFDDIYSIEVAGGNKLNAKVLIDWKSGRPLYDRACIDLLAAATVLAGNEWTASDCVNERIKTDAALRSFSIVNQFVDEDEALRLADEFTATLKDLSGLP